MLNIINNKNLKKITALTLVLCSLVYVLPSCKKPEEPQTADTSIVTEAPSDTEFSDSDNSNKFKNPPVQDTPAQEVLSDIIPQIDDSGRYILKLSEDQRESIESAKCILLERWGRESYVYIDSSIDTEITEDSLISSFTGKHFYVINSFNHITNALYTKREDNEIYSRYILPFVLTSNDDNYSSKGFIYNILLNNSTDEIEKVVITANSKELTIDELQNGEYTDEDMSAFTNVMYFMYQVNYPTRFDDNVMKSTEEWEIRDSFSPYDEGYLGDEPRLTYSEPAQSGLGLVFEITNKDGSKYCSEILPLEEKNRLTPIESEEAVEFIWQEGDRVELGEYSGVTAALTVIQETSLDEPSYCYDFTNNNDFDVCITIENIFVNDNIYIYDNLYITLGTGENNNSVYPDILELGDLSYLDVVDKIEKLSFTITVRKQSEQYKPLIYSKPLIVTLPDRDDIPIQRIDLNYDWNVRNILATEQVLYNSNGIELTLIGLGGEFGAENDINIVCKVTNSSGTDKNVTIPMISFDNLTFETNTYIWSIYHYLPKDSSIYLKFTLDSAQLDEKMVYSAETVKLLFGISNSSGIYPYFEWCDVNLEKNGRATLFTEGEEIIYQEDGLRIALIDSYIDNYGKYIHEFSVVNESATDYFIRPTDIKINSKPAEDPYVYSFESNMIPAGEKCYLKSTLSKAEDTEEISFRLKLLDLTEEKLYGISESEIVLSISTVE